MNNSQKGLNIYKYIKGSDCGRKMVTWKEDCHYHDTQGHWWMYMMDSWGRRSTSWGPWHLYPDELNVLWHGDLRTNSHARYPDPTLTETGAQRKIKILLHNNHYCLLREIDRNSTPDRAFLISSPTWKKIRWVSEALISQKWGGLQVNNRPTWQIKSKEDWLTKGQWSVLDRITQLLWQRRCSSKEQGMSTTSHSNSKPKSARQSWNQKLKECDVVMIPTLSSGLKLLASIF
jgi:hypothetical protein